MFYDGEEMGLEVSQGIKRSDSQKSVRPPTTIRTRRKYYSVVDIFSKVQTSQAICNLSVYGSCSPPDPKIGESTFKLSRQGDWPVSLSQIVVEI